MKKYIILGGALASVPSMALAAGQGLSGVLDVFSGLIATAVPIIISLAVLYFLWGLTQYMLNPEDKDDAKAKMIGGIIALFVMVSIWGLVNLLTETLDLDTNINIENPIDVIN